MKLDKFSQSERVLLLKTLRIHYADRLILGAEDQARAVLKLLREIERTQNERTKL